MTNFPNRPSLKIVAFELGEEIREGRWNHVSGISTKPATACDELIKEFEERCPGYSRLEYQQALAEGLFESR